MCLHPLFADLTHHYYLLLLFLHHVNELFDGLIVHLTTKAARFHCEVNIHQRGEYRIRTDDPLLAKQVL